MTVLSVVRSEVTKICTLPSVWLVAGILVALHVLVLQVQSSFYVRAVRDITPAGTIEIIPGLPEPAGPAIVGDVVAASIQVGLFVCVLGAVTAGSEFRAGQLGSSVLAVPSRVGLVVAKFVATALCALVVGLVMAAASTASMYVAVRSWNPTILLSSPALAGQARFLLFVVTSTTTAASITLIARRTLVGILAAGVLIALTMTQVVAALAPGVDALLPVSAARNLLLTPGPGEVPLTASPAHGALVLVGWAAVTTIAAALTLQGRDAR